MKKVIVFLANITLILSFSLAPIMAIAQDQGGPPADIKK